MQQIQWNSSKEGAREKALVKLPISKIEGPAPQFWKKAPPLKKHQFRGQKHLENAPKFFYTIRTYIKFTFCKKIGPNRPIQPSSSGPNILLPLIWGSHHQLDYQSSWATNYKTPLYWTAQYWKLKTNVTNGGSNTITQTQHAFRINGGAKWRHWWRSNICRSSTSGGAIHIKLRSSSYQVEEQYI